MVNENTHKIRLESIAPGGDALGRLENGKTVFVQGGAPGETIICRIVKEQKNYAYAELLEITEPSDMRIESVCEFYGKCGGCNLLHIDYEAQLEIKKNILKDSFLRIGGFTPPEPIVFPSLPYGYRNRMSFHCLKQKGKSGNLKFGLKGRKSSEIVEVTDCSVADAGIRSILQNNGKSSMPLFADTLLPEKERFTIFSKDEVLLIEGGGVERGKISLLGKEITLDASVFFQSNIAMLEKLILKLREIAEEADRNLPMADLYCGVGTFSVFLCDLFPKTILAEENKKAISIARENLKNKTVELFALRDTDWEQAFLRKNREFGFVVIDPPRTGLNRSLAETLARNSPPVLAYVSCDAASLARDSAIFLKGGYQLKELLLFDFYPQTAHIETLAVFIR